MFVIGKYKNTNCASLFCKRYAIAMVEACEISEFAAFDGTLVPHYAYLDPFASSQELLALTKIIEEHSGAMKLIASADFEALEYQGHFGTHYLSIFKRDIVLHSEMLILTPRSLEFLSGIDLSSEGSWEHATDILKTMGVKNICVFDLLLASVFFNFEDGDVSYYDQLHNLPETALDLIKSFSNEILKARLEGRSYKYLSSELMQPFIREKQII